LQCCPSDRGMARRSASDIQRVLDGGVNHMGGISVLRPMPEFHLNLDPEILMPHGGVSRVPDRREEIRCSLVELGHADVIPMVSSIAVAGYHVSRETSPFVAHSIFPANRHDGRDPAATCEIMAGETRHWRAICEYVMPVFCLYSDRVISLG
jgi:hypothetical protein